MASVTEAKTMCEEKQAELDEEISKLNQSKAKLATESDQLKKGLYAKFGNQIMLDES